MSIGKRGIIVIVLSLVFSVALVSAGFTDWFGKITGNAVETTPNGLKATYYNDVDFTGTTVERVDSRIDFNWLYGSPDSAISSNTFSARWEGYIISKYSETYTFYTYSNDGMRIYVNNQLVVSDWSDHLPRERSGKIDLVAGRAYPIKVEYYESDKTATAKVLWSSSSQSKEIIPSSALKPSQSTGDQNPPTPPSNLGISSQTDSTVSLFWGASTDDVGVVEYRIYRNGILIGTSTTTSFTDEFSGGGGDQTPPTAPTNLAVASQTDSSVTFMWGASTDDVGVTGYNVYRDGANVGGSAVTSFTDDFTDSPTDLTPPTAPVITTSSSSSAGDSVSLGWSASTDDIGVIGYKIYRDGVLIGDTATTSFLDNNVIAGNTYNYYIKAYDASGKMSVESNTVSVKVEAPIGGLSISRLVLVNADTEAEITDLRNGYEINFATLGTQNVNIRADVSGSAGSVRFNLDGNVNYHIENTKPYFIGGDTSGNANAWTPTLGSHTLIVTPYIERSGAGTTGTAKTLTFRVTGTPTGQCTDSDGGNNRYIMGTVTYGSGLPAIFEDTCIDSSTLREGFCSGSSLGTQDIICSAGCSNGACLPDSPGGDKPDATNTGPSNPTLLRTYTGPMTITQDGTVIENAIMNGELNIQANNVVVRNFRISHGSTYGIRATNGKTGIIVEDGEISGMTNKGIYGGGLTARRLNIHNIGNDAFYSTHGNLVVENTWMHHLGTASGAHADGVQIRRGSNYIMKGNNFDMPKGVSGTKSNSPVFTQSAEGPVNNVVIENNWINGGNFGIHMDDGVTGMVIRNNLWGNDCKYGLISINGGNPVWENNRWEDTGEIITLSQATNSAGSHCDEGA